MAPRIESYGSIKESDHSFDVEETVPLEVQEGRTISKKKGWSGSSKDSWLKMCNKTVVGGCAILAVVALALTHLHKTKNVEDDTEYNPFQPKKAPASDGGKTTITQPLSMLSPEEDLGLFGIDREEDASPSQIWGDRLGPLPTNSWYLNLVSHHANKPDDSTRVYTVPYIIDTAPAKKMSGLRVHWPVVIANDKNIQMVDDFKNGISLGTMDEDVSRGYKVDDEEDLSMLGVSLKWGESTKGMLSHIVRGMPYSTMQYFGGVLPSLYSYNGPASLPVIDGKKKLECGVMDGKPGVKAVVDKEVKLHFINSDFTWIMLFSRPVEVRCAVSEGDEKTAEFQLNVDNYDDDGEEPLTVRLALIDQCTTGESDIKQHCLEKAEWQDQEGYVQLLKESAHVLPSSPRIDFGYPEENDSEAKMTIDWGAETTTDDESDKDKLLMFALPHHQDSLATDDIEITEHCIPTFHGSTCLVKGDNWVLSEDVGNPLTFTATRPPEPEAIPALADAISEDIHYRLSSNLHRGAADTYFSGKLLARLGRVIVIADELRKLAVGTSFPEEVQALYDDVDEQSLSLSVEAASSVDLPSDKDITNAVKQLKQAVEVWLGDAEAPYVFDRSWGGLVNCGCNYVGKGEHGGCKNKFPDCPALVDVNIDFGNGYYNDHHFHYGYHIYAAAVVAKFDSSWGKQYFDKILLYVRDIANPSADDKYFTQFRQKDWYLGSSWASGIVSGENSPHGRNQESSSEAIAAYEAIGLYGSVMMDAFGDDKSESGEFEAAKLVRDVGQLLTATEVHAANRYWHVWSSDTHVNTYPSAYTKPAVGMLYETMASFQTWFAPQAVVSYGIQLLPFTPVAEIRDDPEWACELYPLYEESCETAGDFCVDNGWSIIQAGLLATTGKHKEALEQALSIPNEVFASDGGLGNSLTNTIWYIATRKPVECISED